MKKINTQSGFTLLELMLVLSIIAGLSVIEIQRSILKAEQRAATQLGAEIHMITAGVQKFVAYNSGTQSSLPAGPQNGVSWLFGDKCNTGVASRANPDFISLCGFLQNPDGSETTRFGKLGITTTFVPDPGNNYLESLTVFDELIVQGKHRADLAGLSAMVANGMPSIDGGPAPQMTSDVFITYCIEGGRRDGIFSNCTGHDRQIIAVTTNSSVSDRWLRTDNGNTMKNILEFDPTTTGVDPVYGFSLRQIKNVARLYNDTLNDPLFLGRGGRAPTMADVGVVVDTNQEVLGALQVTGGDLVIKSSGGAGGSIEADLDISSGRDIAAIGSVNAGSDLTAGNDLSVKNDATIENDTYTKRIFDFDDPSYYLDPSQDSNLKDIVAETSVIPDMKADMLGSIGNDLTLKTDSATGKIILDTDTLNLLQSKIYGNVDLSDFVITNASGRRVRLIDALPKKSLEQTYIVNMPHSNYVPKPDCAIQFAGGTATTRGTPQIVVVPTVVEAHSLQPEYGHKIHRAKWFVSARDDFTGWTVEVKSSYADRGTGAAVAMTYCSWE